MLLLNHQLFILTTTLIPIGFSTILNSLCGPLQGHCVGNKQFLISANAREEYLLGRNSASFTLRNITVLIYSVWVGKTPLNSVVLNHKQYCDLHGYEYEHFFFPLEKFNSDHSGISGAWASVMVAKQLLETRVADYFLKMDIDCLFSRGDLRIESALDPFEQYSFYITQTRSDMFFMQSQSWILKNTNFSKTLIDEWLGYRHWGNCNNMANEQGALHLALGTMYSRNAGRNTTQYACPGFCNKKRNLYQHHVCVSDWIKNNGLDLIGHPDIFIYSFFDVLENHGFMSPDDGFFSQVPTKVLPLLKIYLPLTVHPCKSLIYSSPTDVMANLSICV